jgi:hypothetical protein
MHASIVLPLEGGSPSHMMVIVFEDGLMLLFGEMTNDSGEPFFKVEKGSREFYSFANHPQLKKCLQADGSLQLLPLTTLIPFGRRL